MKRMTSIILMCFIAATVLSGCGPYYEHGKLKKKDDHRDKHVIVIFTDDDRRIIHDYYRKNLPPGLAKKDKLPPGLQKQLEKKGSLPPGLEKRTLPAALETRLSPLPAGYVRLKVDDDIVLLNEITQVIVDIIYHVGY